VHHGRGLNHSISVCGALECDPASLPIDPYLFGAWLGDGSSYGARLTIAEPQMAALAASAAESCGWSVRKGATKYDYGVRGGLKVKLREAGVLENKHIPPQYLRASVPQRLALLQGLMDTDGYADPRGQCEYTTTSSKLAADALELINSLGIKAVICEGRAMLRGRDCGPKYRIKFLTELPVFRLDRKLARQKRAGFRGTSARRYIVSVEPVKTVPVRCISVDSPSKLFLCGREMIPTHNSDLGLGLAFTAHRRSLILRRRYTNLGALIDRAVEINGTKDGFNGSPPPKIRTADGRHIEFGANQHLGDEQGWQGQPFDLKVFDEGVQFLESQVRFHIGWLRSTVPGQRVRALLATNPPIDSDGDWIIGMFRPWLDITHPKPAEPGVLRWFVTAPDGADLEVEGPTPVQLGGMKLIPMSRTFIPAELSDNPFLVNTDYQAKLDGLPEPLRSAVRDGNFMAARQDADFQVIPMAWIIAAQDRWKPDGHKAFNMTAMGFDPAGGGADAAELAWRHGGWYAPLITAKGEQTADGSAAAGTIISHRRDSAPVIVDVGGGYGGAVTLRLKDNGIAHSGFNGAAASHARTRDGQLRFANKRAEAWWKFREELDPDQQGGSVICLPPDPELRADLAAPTYEVAARGILIESKEEIRKRLGRSPGKGDACIMALSEGNAAVKRSLSHTGPLQTTANLGYASMKKRR
jgi:hypothetical protein